MWSIYERDADGLWDGVDGGTLRVTGVNRYEAVSDGYLVIRKKVDRYSEVRRFNNLRTSCLSIDRFLKVPLWEP